MEQSHLPHPKLLSWLRVNTLKLCSSKPFLFVKIDTADSKPWPSEQALSGKYLKFCLSTTMFVGLDVFEIDLQTVLVKQCLSWWPNGQACLTSVENSQCLTSNACRFGLGLNSIDHATTPVIVMTIDVMDDY